MQQSFALVFNLLLLVNIAWAACDEPERHLPRKPFNRGQGRGHGNPGGTLPIYQQPGEFSPENDGRSDLNSIQLVPIPNVQIPVAIVHEPHAEEEQQQEGRSIVPTERTEVCPEPTDGSGIKSRFHKETGKCYIPNSENHPCGIKMAFYPDPSNEVYGYCDCLKADPEQCDYRPLAYWPSENRCYNLHDQGPCAENEWLVEGSDIGSSPTCTQRTCPANPTEGPDDIPKKWFLQHENCYQLETQAYCENPNEKVYYTEEKGVLKCSTDPIIKKGGCVRVVSYSQLIPCADGQQRDQGGKCGSGVNI